MKKRITPKTTKKVVAKSPLEDMTIENKVDYTLVVVEGIRDSIQAVAENLGGVWKEVIALRTRTDAIFEETGRTRIELSHIKHRLDVLERDSGIIRDDVRLIRADVTEIKKTFTTKADMKYITLFEARVARLEKRFA